MSNLETVQQIYASFGAGDIPGILSKLADDVDWDYSGGSSDVPWLQRRRGREAAAGFFQALGALEFTKFAPKEMLTDGNVVVALLDVEFTVKANGKHVAEEDEVHVWRFNDKGQVTRFKHGVETHQHVLAYKG
jgi:ketosteroid isomerase-like protein